VFIVFSGVMSNNGYQALMRQHIAESRIDEAHHDEMLTTGEAARLLNSSRQHVVDLCNRGDLPFVTVGTHRRVHRSDVEAVAERTLRLTRDQRRSLWLAFAVAGKIVADPDATRMIVARNLSKMRGKARGRTVLWLDEWERLVEGPVPRLLSAMTSRSPHGRELRQNTPFAGVLSDAERMAVLGAWRSADRSLNS
jgi:excisionase family DNA binding protein